MPTTVDRFFAVVQICQNIATMQNNMRSNVVLIGNAYSTGPGPLQGNIPATRQAFRDLGRAFNQRLAMNQAIMTTFPAQLAAGAAALGIQSTDVSGTQNLLEGVATNLENTNVATSSGVTALVNGVLATVPAAMLPF